MDVFCKEVRVKLNFQRLYKGFVGFLLRWVTRFLFKDGVGCVGLGWECGFGFGIWIWERVGWLVGWLVSFSVISYYED